MKLPYNETVMMYCSMALLKWLIIKINGTIHMCAEMTTIVLVCRLIIDSKVH